MNYENLNYKHFYFLSKFGGKRIFFKNCVPSVFAQYTFLIEKLESPDVLFWETLLKDWETEGETGGMTDVS